MTNGVRIRPFEPADQARACALIEEGLGEHFGFVDTSLNPDIHDIAATYGSAHSFFVVAEWNGTLAGTGALITESADIGRLVRISVGQAWRRQGLGRAIVSHLLAIARREDIKRVLVETNDDWQDAIGLYLRLGFTPTDHRAGEIHMTLDLE